MVRASSARLVMTALLRLRRHLFLRVVALVAARLVLATGQAEEAEMAAAAAAWTRMIG